MTAVSTRVDSKASQAQVRSHSVRQHRRVESSDAPLSVKTRIGVLVAQLVTIGTLGWLWQNVDAKQATFLSRPTDIWDALYHWLTTPLLLKYIPTTLAEAGLGLVIALAIAIFFASLLAASRRAADIFGPLISVLNAVPKIALGPMFLLLFGLGFLSKVYFVAAGVTFIPFYSLFAALTTIDPTLLANVRMLGAKPSQRIRDVYIPAVIGAAAASLRLATAFSLLGAVVAELIASQSGIGYEIATAQSTDQNDYVVAGILIIAVIALIVDRVTVRLQRHFATWKVSA